VKTGDRGRRRRRPVVTGNSFEERRERFLAAERRDAQTYERLTTQQKRNPKWRRHEAQRQAAAKVGLTLLLAGEQQLPEPLLRLLEPPPVAGAPSGLFSSVEGVLLRDDMPGRDASGPRWGARWGSAWRRPETKAR
jgi:hypothetical protein